MLHYWPLIFLIIALVHVIAFQAKQSAELLSPFGQTLLTHAHQDRSIVSHHGHAHLDHGALKAFVAHLIRAARHQRRNVPFDYWAAVATGAGQMNLMRRPDAV